MLMTINWIQVNWTFLTCSSFHNHSCAASADDDQTCGAGKGSGKRSGPANGEPESEPCQRGGLHLEGFCECLSRLEGLPGNLCRKNKNKPRSHGWERPPDFHVCFYSPTSWGHVRPTWLHFYFKGVFLLVFVCLCNSTLYKLMTENQDTQQHCCDIIIFFMQTS